LWPARDIADRKARRLVVRNRASTVMRFRGRGDLGGREVEVRRCSAADPRRPADASRRSASHRKIAEIASSSRSIPVISICG
jgi:hypothetical protein